MRCLVLLLFGKVAVAHMGKVYPIYELSDEMLERIDIHDGFIDEWYEIAEPTMTLADFQTFRNWLPADPSNLDFRIWLAWHDEPDRIYAAFMIIDDVYKNTHDYDATSISRNSMGFQDGITFYLDADHSGGRGYDGILNETDEETMQIIGQTQGYMALAQTVRGPTLGIEVMDHTTWKVHPPYGDAGGSVAGENPTVSVIEMYVTPYDWWDSWTDKDLTGFSELSPHQVVGFAIGILDNDPGKEWQGISLEWHPVDIDVEDPDRDVPMLVADSFLDGVLLPAQETAIESTWGRIKASLE